MGGGPSQQQQDAATAQANLDNQLGATFGKQQQFMETQQNKVNPFYTSMMDKGLPYMANLTDSMSGSNAQAFAPARAQLEQQLNQNPNALPSGFAQQARTDLASQQARNFDQQLQGAQGANYQAQQQGAAGLVGQAQVANPTAYSGQAAQGNNSIMNAPLAKPGLGGLLGGIGGSLVGMF
jgi:hypothetical protein